MASPSELRVRGNEAFKRKEYFEAYRLLLLAIQRSGPGASPELAETYLDLSRIEQVLERVREAILSATKGIENNKTNPLGYVRRADAYFESMAWQEAYNDYNTASEMQPTDQHIKDRLQQSKAALDEAAINPPKPVEPKPPSAPRPPVQPRPLPAPPPSPPGQYTVSWATELMRDLGHDKRPPQPVLMAMLDAAEQLHRQLPNLVPIQIASKITVVGDTHGQYPDVVAIFDRIGPPSAQTPYLFNGDMVDRGSMGVEIIILLVAWKLAVPNGLFINRGNQYVFSLIHSEQRSMNALGGFDNECTLKYSAAAYDKVSAFFESLPIGHTINGKVLVVHGGLMRDQEMTVDRVQLLDRFGQPDAGPEFGPINDLLWSDPMERRGFATSPRGTTNAFGPDVTEKFLAANHLEILIRSHQVQENGYLVQHGGKCITVFSAPNYMGLLGNKGAICQVVFNANGILEPLAFMALEPQQMPRNYPAGKYAPTIPRFF
jgi:serine/threonine-protein phosphatase 5